MLAAVGATERHLRLVMVASGAVTGAVAATLGAVLGVAGWVAVVPRVEQAAGNRIDAFNVPWWLVVTGMVLAVLAATGAAWWPARTMARIPTVLALSGRPPRPTPAHRSAAMAGAFVAGGVVCLGLGSDVADETALDWTNALLILAGIVAVVLGVLLLSPVAIRALAGCASRFPIAPRLALRDLGRYQARSGAALAAISLALGIPVAIVVMAAAAEHTAAAGNLSDRQLLIRAADIDGPFVPETADVAGLQAGVDRLVAALDETSPDGSRLDGTSVVALDAALDPAASASAEFDGRMAISLAQRSGDGWTDLSLLFVATPVLQDRFGLALDRIEGEDVDIFTVEDVETAELAILGVNSPTHRSDPEVVEDAVSLPESYSSLPGSFITADGLRQRGWDAAPSGRWLVETGRPLTGEQLSTAREVAAGAGLTIESRDQQQGLATLRAGATVVGMLLALGILAMTVGLIRSEAAADVRTLTATGATSGTRRSLSAATAGGLAFLGVVLGTVGAYVALMAGHVRHLGALSPIPVVDLVAIVLGTPLAAAAAGWLLAGREPSALSREVIQ